MNKKRILSFLVLFIVLLAVAPPNGIFINNEETKFGMAMRFVNPDWNPHSFSFSIPQQFYFIFDIITGHLILLFGFEWTQIIGRILTAAFYSLSLLAFFEAIGFALIEGLIVILAFCSIGQSLVGMEWIFGGYEPKTIAYTLVFFGLAFWLDKKPVKASVMAGLATLAHIHVGGFMALFLFATQLAEKKSIRPLLKPFGVYLLFFVTFIACVWERYAPFLFEANTNGRNLDFIFAVRDQHHTLPFYNQQALFETWIPGMAVIVGMLISAISMLRHTTGNLKRIGLMSIIVHGYLLVIFALTSNMDIAVFLGKFLVFRPASLGLILWLCFVVGYFKTHCPEKIVQLFKPATLFLFLTFVSTTIVPLVQDWINYRNTNRLLVPLHKFANDYTPEDAIFAVSPDNEWHYLDFERKTNRAIYVMRKFVVAEEHKALQEWFNRLHIVDEIFTKGCKSENLNKIDYIISRAHKAKKFKGCTEAVQENPMFALLKITHNTKR